MPIYEFFCKRCNTIFNFYSKTVDTFKRPDCPRCKSEKLIRQMSPFAFTGKAKEPGDAEDLPFDETKMEQAMSVLAGQVDKIDENDPKQAANLMRKLTEMTGMELNPKMQEALTRMEKGEDPEQVEAEMGDLMGDDEDPFILPGKKGKGLALKQKPPRRDETLYDL